MFKLGRKSLKHMIGLHPYLAFAVHEAIKRSKVDFIILSTGGVRSDELQLGLWAKGRTIAGRKVTWTKDSRHQYGLAVDVVAYVDGKPSWDEKYYDEIARAMKEVIAEYNLPIDWLFDLRGVDKPHWQITKLDGKDAKEVYDIRKIKG